MGGRLLALGRVVGDTIERILVFLTPLLACKAGSRYLGSEPLLCDLKVFKEIL